MQPNPTSPEVDSPEQPLPPLRLRHLLAITTTCALSITGLVAFDRWVRGGPAIDHPVVIGCMVVIAAAVSASVVATAVQLRWRWRGLRGRLDPGARLSVAIAVAAIGYFAALIVSLLVFHLNHDAFPVAWIVSRVLLILWLLAYLLRGVASPNSCLAWRVAFASLTASVLSMAIAGWHFWCTILAVPVALAAAQDLITGTSRHWTHWLGAAAMLGILIALATITLFPDAASAPVRGYFGW